MKTVYAFIDSQNLNLGTSNDIYRNGKQIYKGWKLDFRKFHTFLTDKYRTDRIFLFIGYIPRYKPLYESLVSYGFELIFKQTVNDGGGNIKGNVDAELVLHSAAVEFANFDSAVIVSGDGDFYCLHEFLEKRGKLRAIIIPNTKSESTLLKRFHKYKVYLGFERNKLEFRP